MISTHTIAEIYHEANRIYCNALGDYTQKKWADAPAWQIESALIGVEAFRNGIATSPENIHISWMREKEVSGWVYGETKDATAKTHPCMVPYDQLPKEQRVKDHLLPERTAQRAARPRRRGRGRIRRDAPPPRGGARDRARRREPAGRRRAHPAAARSRRARCDGGAESQDRKSVV